MSESAASVVLNGAKSHTRVSPKTRQMVVDAARELGYRPNTIARALSSGKTGRLGIYASHVVFDPTDPFWVSIQAGLYKEAREYDIDLVVHTGAGNMNRLIEMLSDRAVDGLVLAVLSDDPVLALVEERCVPAVAVVERIEELPSVCVDDYAGGVLMAEHLFEKGHRHALLPLHRMVTSRSTIARMAGFQDTADRLGMRTTVDGTAEGNGAPITESELRILMDEPDRATAFATWCDTSGMNVCERLSDLGIEIPGQVAVVAFDGHRPYFRPRFTLTSIRANWESVARSGLRTLMDVVEGKHVEMHKTLPVEFRPGNTT